MIPFNKPPYIGKEPLYISNAVQNQKICGDGTYTKQCNAWAEQKIGRAERYYSHLVATHWRLMICHVMQ